MSQVLVSNDYLINEANKCPYSNYLDTNTYELIFIYEDMLRFRINMNEVIKTKSILTSLREANVIHCIRESHIANGLT